MKREAEILNTFQKYQIQQYIKRKYIMTKYIYPKNAKLV